MTKKDITSDVVRLHGEGYSVREITTMLDSAQHGRVAKILRQAGLEPIKKTKAERECDELIIQSAKRGLTLEEILERVRVSETYVRELLRSICIKVETEHQRKCRLNKAAIIRMRAEKKTYAEIADVLELAPSKVKRICSELGSIYSQDERSRSYSKASKIAQELEALDIGLEYVGGYTVRNRPMTVRMLTCGHEFELQWHSITTNKRENVICPICQRERKEQKQKAAKIKYNSYIKNCVVCGEPLRGPLYAARKFCSKECQIKLHTLEQTERLKADFVPEARTCKNCGKEYRTEFKWRAQCCSQECQKAYEQKVKHEKYAKRYSGKIVDTDITLRKVWARAGGVCAICGGACDWADHYKDKKGYFVMGKRYPTIDHIKPLSKGGLHAWSNVQLACQICNSLKSDSYQEAI